MRINELKTPAFLVDLDQLERNIFTYQGLAQEHNKVLIPMTKTHKCSDIAKLQMDAGAKRFLVGTIEEALTLSTLDIEEITIAYPLIHSTQLNLLNKVSDRVNLTLSIDSLEAAKIYHDYFSYFNKSISYLLMINSGLNRFGIDPIQAAVTVDTINKQYPNLLFKGISTHSGHVYKEQDTKGVLNVAVSHEQAVRSAVQSLTDQGFKPEVIATGSTPTFTEDLNGIFNVLRPGNYVFNDAIQMALGIAKQEECAFTVLTTILSNPREGVYILDCGSKCLGLDKGAHGNTNIVGYGQVINHPELIIEGLSEEVAVVKSTKESKLQVGDQLRIIPNHSCSAANMTSYFIGVRGDVVDHLLEVDMRGNSVKPTIE